MRSTRRLAHGIMLCALLTGCGRGAASPTQAQAMTSPSPSPSTAKAPRLTRVQEAPAPAATSKASLPVRVIIPSIGVNSDLERLHVDKAGVLMPPADYGTAGWYAAGTVPGDIGPAVVAGHIDSTTGPAVFARLHALQRGAQVLVDRADGSRLSFSVDEGHSYPKNSFPTAAVYGPTPVASLRLITCTGKFDRASGHYMDNFVVFTHLIAYAQTTADRVEADPLELALATGIRRAAWARRRPMPTGEAHRPRTTYQRHLDGR